MARVQPERRSSPMKESLRQPIQAIRVWPLSSRCSVASCGAGRAVDVDPGVGRVGVVPRPAERDERRPLAGQPGGLRVAEVGVGDDEGVDGGGAQQVVVAADRVVRRTGEQQHVVAAVTGGLHERVDEAVHRGVGGALLGRVELQADQVAGAGAQVAGGAVGRVAQLGDRVLDAGERVGTQELGVVDGVGDGLPRHAGPLGHVGQRRRRERHAPGPRHEPSLLIDPMREDTVHGPPRGRHTRTGVRRVGRDCRRCRGTPSVRTMSKTPHPSYLCSECGWTSAKWVGRCGECQAWGSVAEAAAARTTRADPGPVTSAAVPDRPGLGRVRRLPQQRRARARPGARRRPRAGRRDPAGRRARRRQEHAAARGRGADRPLPTPHPLRHRRGVGLPGATARRPHRRRPRRALPRRRDRSRRDPHPRRAGPPRGAGGRLGADHRRGQRRRRARAASPRSRRSRPR